MWEAGARQVQMFAGMMNRRCEKHKPEGKGVRAAMSNLNSLLVRAYFLIYERHEQGNIGIVQRRHSAEREARIQT